MALIPYANEDPADERVRAILGRLPDPQINLFTMLANAPVLIGPTLRLGEAILTRSDLDASLRELVILQTARLTGTEYEWVQHEAIARLLGVAEEKIRAIDRGETSGHPLTGSEVSALRLVTHLVQGGAPPPELVLEIASEFGRSQLIELMLIAGYYAMLGGVMRAVQIDVDNVVEKGMLKQQLSDNG